MTRAILCLGLLLLTCTACDESQDAVQPNPAQLSRDAIGYYCNMIVADHQGPKAQIFLAGRSDPIWFSSVRDGIAFTLLPEEPKNRSAFYVHDMGKADWSAPENDHWISAAGAYYVIESAMRGGMGASEAVPFSERVEAEAFAARHGGRVVTLAQIPQSYILSAEVEDVPGHGTQQRPQADPNGAEGHED